MHDHARLVVVEGRVADAVLHHVFGQHPARLHEQVEQNGQANVSEKAFDGGVAIR